MRGTMLYGPREVRSEERPDPTIVGPTDAVIRLSAACVCGSDLWPYRGHDQITEPMPMGHEDVEIVAAIAHQSTGAVRSDRRSDPLMTHPETA